MHNSGKRCSDYVCDFPFQEVLKNRGYFLVKKETYNDGQLTIFENPGTNLNVLVDYINVLGNPAIGAIGYLLSGEDNASFDEKIHTELVREGGFSADLLNNPLITEQCRVYRKDGSYALSLDDAAKILSAITGEGIEVDDAASVMDISAETSILLN